MTDVVADKIGEYDYEQWSLFGQLIKLRRETSHLMRDMSSSTMATST